MFPNEMSFCAPMRGTSSPTGGHMPPGHLLAPPLRIAITARETNHIKGGILIDSILGCTLIESVYAEQ